MTSTTGVPRPAPQRAVRPRSTAEKAFCQLGPAAEAFIKAAAARGMTGLARDLDELSQLEAIHGREPVIGALERAVAFGRFRSADVVSILHSGAGVPRPTRPGEALIVDLPVGASSLAVRLRHRGPAMTATPPPLAADLEAGLRRLRLSAIRTQAPELLVTATTQRWKPEQLLRVLVEAEIASRDLSNARGRMKVAAFPVTKTLEEFDVAASSVPRPTFDYLARLEWIRAKENLCLVGPAGTGKSHLLVALGHAAIEEAHRVRYFTAAELVETLYRALADNSVGKIITQILNADLILIDEIGFAPMDPTGAELFFRLVAAAYERRSLGIGSHWPFEQWGKFLPEHTTAVSLLDRLLHHSVIVVTDGESFRMKEARQNGGRSTLAK